MIYYMYLCQALFERFEEKAENDALRARSSTHKPYESKINIFLFIFISDISFLYIYYILIHGNYIFI